MGLAWILYIGLIQIKYTDNQVQNNHNYSHFSLCVDSWEQPGYSYQRERWVIKPPTLFLSVSNDLQREITLS